MRARDKFYLFIGGVASACIVFGVIYFMTYNGLVQADEKVSESYAQVQNVYQRQADLIPNLVETAKGYAAHERATLSAVTEARAQLSAVAKMNPKDIANNPELQKKLIEVQEQANQAFLQINALREAYPNLKANEHFTNVMTELAGSQNRISVERRRAQQATLAYNVKTRTVISGWVAGRHGFAAKTYYEASAGAQTVPSVRF